MKFLVYQADADAQDLGIPFDDLSEAAEWVTTSGDNGVSYIIKKVETVDLAVLTVNRPRLPDPDDAW